MNLFVFIFVSTVFGLQGAILSAIAYFIASKVIHIVEEGLSGSKTFKIISSEPKLMVETIRDRLGEVLRIRKRTVATLMKNSWKSPA